MQIHIFRGCIAMVILTCLSVTSHSLAADKPAIALIVAHEHVIKNFSLSELKLIYWRKKTYWADGQPIHPVNLPSDNALRLQFSNAVLGSTPSTQNDYWNGLYFHGTSPPHVVYSEEAVVRYIQETKGSIGYIDACKLDTRIKPLLWIMPNGDISNNAPSINCN
jgi:ABC-type phosphate transport system substrate-binding protein